MCVNVLISFSSIALGLREYFFKADIFFFCTGCDTVVPCTWSPPWLQPVLMSRWYLVSWLYICWNDHKAATLPWWLGNWSALQNIQVYILFSHLDNLLDDWLNFLWTVRLCTLYILTLINDNYSCHFRTLTTPTEETWPGVTQLQDYKANFPKWTDYNLANSVKQMDSDGLDLLSVCIYWNVEYYQLSLPQTLVILCYGKLTSLQYFICSDMVLKVSSFLL